MGHKQDVELNVLRQVLFTSSCLWTSFLPQLEPLFSMFGRGWLRVGVVDSPAHLASSYWMKTMLTLHSAADSAALSVAVKILHQPKKPLPAYCWHAKLNNSVIVHHAIRRSSFCSVNSWWQPTLTDQRLGSFVQVCRNRGRSKQTSLSDTLKFFGQKQLPEWNLMEYL